MKVTKSYPIKDSKVFVNRIIKGSEYTGENGVEYIKTRWEEINKPINFGSCTDKKNTDVVSFKIEVPDNKRKNIFRGLLGE